VHRNIKALIIGVVDSEHSDASAQPLAFSDWMLDRQRIVTGNIAAVVAIDREPAAN